MKGDIKVFSKEGLGTTFIVCIPTECIRTPENTRIQIIPRFGNKELSVLIVDDELLGRNVLKNYLTELW